MEMELLGGIFFHVDPVDADLALAALGSDLDPAVASDRMELLGDLIALRQVGIVVVLTVKADQGVDLQVQGRAGFDGLADRFLVDAGQCARMGQIDDAVAGIGRFLEGIGCSGEHLGRCFELYVDLNADDDIVFHQ